MQNLTPSASTTSTLLGGAVVSVVVWVLGLKGITMPAGIEAAVASIVAAAIGYLPSSGRARSTGTRTRLTDIAITPKEPPK